MDACHRISLISNANYLPDSVIVINLFLGEGVP